MSNIPTAVKTICIIRLDAKRYYLIMILYVLWSVWLLKFQTIAWLRYLIV